MGHARPHADRSLLSLLLFSFCSPQIKIEKTLIYFEISGPGVEAEPRDVLRIDRNTGVITVHRPVDYEIDKSLMVIII